MPDIAELRNVARPCGSTLRRSPMLHIDSDMGIPPALVLNMLQFRRACGEARSIPKKDRRCRGRPPPAGRRARDARSVREVEGVGAGCPADPARWRMIRGRGVVADTRINAFASPFRSPLASSACCATISTRSTCRARHCGPNLSFCLRWGRGRRHGLGGASCDRACRAVFVPPPVTRATAERAHPDMMAVSKMTNRLGRICRGAGQRPIGRAKYPGPPRWARSGGYPALLWAGKSGWVCNGLETRTDHRALGDACTV